MGKRLTNIAGEILIGLGAITIIGSTGNMIKEIVSYCKSEEALARIKDPKLQNIKADKERKTSCVINIAYSAIPGITGIGISLTGDYLRKKEE